MEIKEQTSLYQYISAAVVDGELPRGFSLPPLSDDENQLIWADGAMDGVGMYHMSVPELSEDNRELMHKAVGAAAKGKYIMADKLFSELGRNMHALSVIDALQSFIIDHREELNGGNLYQYGFHALMDSTDREGVKFGLSLLELFDTDSNEERKNTIRTIGLSDEFTLFAIFVMRRWEDGNHEIWQLAKKIHGWGRIHAVECIEPTTEEIKRWLLLDGVHNQISPAYSALVCWQKADVGSVLRRNLSEEEFRAIRDIVEGLLDEGPVSGISEVVDSESSIIVFLNHAKRLASEIEDYETVRSIRIHYEDETSKNPQIVLLCQEILSTENCKAVASEAVKSGRAISLAEELHLDYKADILALMESAFRDKNHLCGILMKDPEYKEQVIELYRRKLSLSEMKTLPTESLGLGQNFWRQSALEFLLQELRRYPLEGQDFVATAMQSAPIRTRNMGLSVLEMWVAAKKIPLSELVPKMWTLLCELREIEPKEDVKKRMDRLIDGNLIFDAQAANCTLKTARGCDTV